MLWLFTIAVFFFFFEWSGPRDDQHVPYRRQRQMFIRDSVSFPAEIDIRKMYGVISAGGGIQEIESIKVYEGKYFVKMKFYREGYFTLEGTHVDIVSVGHVINMKNGQLLYTPQNDDTEYISMT